MLMQVRLALAGAEQVQDSSPRRSAPPAVSPTLPSLDAGSGQAQAAADVQQRYSEALQAPNGALSMMAAAARHVRAGCLHPGP